MNTNFNRFIIKILAVSVIVAILSFLLYEKFPQWISINWTYLMLFFIIVNLILYKLSEKAKQKEMKKFSIFFMSATFLKLFLYLCIIILYFLLNKADIIPFLITFFAYYVIFTIIEVSSVVQSKGRKY